MIDSCAVQLHDRSYLCCDRAHWHPDLLVFRPKPTLERILRCSSVVYCAIDRTLSAIKGIGRLLHFCTFTLDLVVLVLERTSAVSTNIPKAGKYSFYFYFFCYCYFFYLFIFSTCYLIVFLLFLIFY